MCWKEISRNLNLLVAIYLLSVFTAEASDLMDAYQSGIRNNANFKASNLFEMAGEQVLPEAKSFLFPTISIEANRLDKDQSLNAPDLPFVTQGSANFRTQEYAVRFRQTLFDKAAYSGYQKAQLTFEVGKLETLAIHQKFIFDIATEYFDALLSIENASVAKAYLKSSKEQYDQIVANHASGISTKAELHQALSRWQLARVDDISAQNERSNTKRKLEAFTGIKEIEPIPLRKDFSIQDVFSDDDLNISSAFIGSNIDLLKQQINVLIAEKNVAIQRSGHYPKIDLVASYLSENNDGSLAGPGSRSEEVIAGVQLSIPIYSGGRVKSRVLAAKQELKAERLVLLNTKSYVSREIETLIDQARTQNLSVEALEVAVEASQQALDIKIKGFELGTETNLTVLNAQRELFETSSSANSAKYTSLKLYLKIKMLLGTLDVADLEFANGFLG